MFDILLRTAQKAALVGLVVIVLVGVCEGKIIVQNGNDQKVANGYKEVACPQQGFVTKCLDCYETVWDDKNGLYIYIGRGRTIPYVLIYRFANRSEDAKAFMEGPIVRQMQRSNTKHQLEIGETKEYHFGGRTLYGILFTYKLPNQDVVVKSLRVGMKVGSDIIAFNAKYLDGSAYGNSAMSVLEAAVANLRLTDSMPASSPKVATTRPRAVSSRTRPTSGNLKVARSEVASVRYVKYQDPSGYFTATIPQGWRVKTGLKPDGQIDLISYAITVYDPRKPDRELYYNLNTSMGLKSVAARDWYIRNYGKSNLFAKMPVVSPRSTAGFFSAMGPHYGFRDFAVSASLGKSAAGGETVVADCTSTRTGVRMRGVFHAVLSDMKYNVANNMFRPNAGTVDVFPLVEFTILSETAPKEEFLDWQPVLDRCLASIRFTSSFMEQRQRAWAQVMGTSRYIMQQANAVSDMIMDSYRRRNISEDVLSQKRSDATLGYERVLDTETGEYYKTQNGFSDWYDGTRYKPVSDNTAYLSPVSGYINWK